MSGWHEVFSPAERGISQDIAQSSNTIEWVFFVSCGLLGLMLFIIAGNRQRQGDSLGAALSCIGAIVVIVAPILAKEFKF